MFLFCMSTIPAPFVPRVGAGCRSDDPSAFEAFALLCRQGYLDHVQVVVIPEPRNLFRLRCDVLESSGVPVVIHAPYHMHGVNPCEPSCCIPSQLGDQSEIIPLAMTQALEAADATGSPWIVFHPGAIQNNGFDTAWSNLQAFFDQWHDDRIILENLPARSHGWNFIGTTSDEIRYLNNGRLNGTCLDFSHLDCTAVFTEVPFKDLLADFHGLPVRFQHISGKHRGGTEDEHLPLDSPESGLPGDEITVWLMNHPDIATSIEYKGNDTGRVINQVRFFHDHFGGMYPRGRSS
jgi:endonuclease IV